MNVLVSRIVRETLWVSVATSNSDYAKSVAAGRVKKLPRRSWNRAEGEPLFDPLQDIRVPNEEVSTPED